MRFAGQYMYITLHVRSGSTSRDIDIEGHVNNYSSMLRHDADIPIEFSINEMRISLLLSELDEEARDALLDRLMRDGTAGINDWTGWTGDLFSSARMVR